MVYIILLNYNGYNDTLACVESIHKQNYKDYKVIIVDNKSTDDSLEQLQKIVSDKVVLLPNSENGGFAAGCNVGITYVMEHTKEISDEDYILLLNNDTVIEESFLDNLVSEFQVATANKLNPGMAGCKIMYYDKPDVTWYAGGSFDTWRCRGKHFTSEDIDKTKRIDFITGCCQLIPLSVVKQIGLMEEEFFLYFEDVEYCERVKKAGYQLIYIPTAVIYHKCGGSASYVSATSIYYSNRARYLYITKYVKKKIPFILFKMELFLKRLLYRGEKKQAILRVYQYIKDREHM